MKMKNFICVLCALFGVLVIGGCGNDGYKVIDGVITFDVPTRAEGQQSVLRLAVEPIPVVRVGRQNPYRL